MFQKAVKISRNVMVVGANSALGYALCKALSLKGWNLIVAGKNPEELTRLSSDLFIRYGVQVHVCVADIHDPAFSAERLIAQAEAIAPVDALILTVGEAEAAQSSVDEKKMEHIIRGNYSAPARILAQAAAVMATRAAGTLVAITSTSGDHGRGRDYLTASSKGALSLFAAGLRSRFVSSGIHVMTVKPGIIDTTTSTKNKDTKHIDRDTAANIIISAMFAKKDVVYIPSKERFRSLLIALLPEGIVKRFKF